MADILLTVGADYSASIKEFESSINSIVAQLNKDIGNRKIKIGLEIDDTQLKNLNKQIKSIQTSFGSLSGSGNATAINGIATGAKTATANIDKMGSGWAKVSAKLKMVNMDTANLTKSFRNIMKNSSAYPEEKVRALADSLEEVFRLTYELSGSKAIATNADFDVIRQQQKATQDLEDSMRSLYDVKDAVRFKFLKMDTAGLDSSYKKIIANQSMYDTDKIQQLKDAMVELHTVQEQISKSPEIISEADLEKYTQYQNVARDMISKFELSPSTLNETKVLKDYNSTLGHGEDILRKYTAAKTSLKESSRIAYKQLDIEVNKLRDYGRAYEEAMKSGDEAKKAAALKNLSEQTSVVNKTLKETDRVVKENDDATKAFSDRVGGLAGKFTSWLTISQAIMFVVRQLRQMVTNVIELDTAMTELKKVTDETDAAYANFLENAAQRSKGTGATLTDTVNATADFARLGYDIGEAEELADAAIVYKNVGDGIDDIGTASESIISTMQAFGIGAENAMNIVDKFNEVGNNFAISSDGIGESLLRSAAALNAANNTLDESIALTTAANTVVQNPEKVGEIAPNNTAMYCKKIAISVKSWGQLRPRKDFVMCLS